MRDYKGQAALEYLTTYGWALIAILILIAAIVYFGVTNPKDYLPNRCLFPPEIACQAYSISLADNTFNLRLQNNFGDGIAVTSLELYIEGPVDLICTKPINPTSWRFTSSTDLIFTDCNLEALGFYQGKPAKLFLNMSFYPIRFGPTYTNNVQGEIITRVS